MEPFDKGSYLPLLTPLDYAYKFRNITIQRRSYTFFAFLKKAITSRAASNTCSLTN